MIMKVLPNVSLAPSMMSQLWTQRSQPFAGRIGRGSTVRLLWTEGNPHPVHGTATYLNKIKVLEVAEAEDGEDF